MTRSIISLTIGCAALVFVPLFAGGCSDAGSEREATGSVELRLTGTSASGKLYRLRNGVIEVTGATAATVTTEDDVDAGSVTLELKAGAYLARLNDGWSLERGVQTGGTTTFQPVNAVLISMNPLPFTVVEQQTKTVRFQFNAGDEAIELGNGRVIVGIDVNDCIGSAAADCDQDGDGVPAGDDCDDANPATFPGAPEVCDDGVDNDCDALVDEGCGGSSCSLLPQSGCGPGLACYPIGAPSAPNPPLICSAAGSGPEHSPCSASDQCLPGLICSIALGAQQCLIACDPSNPFTCPSGICSFGPGLPVCN